MSYDTDRFDLARKALRLETELNQVIDAAYLADRRNDKEQAKKFRIEADRLTKEWEALKLQLKRGN